MPRILTDEDIRRYETKPKILTDEDISRLETQPARRGVGGAFQVLKPLWEPLPKEKAKQFPPLAKAREVGLQTTTRFISTLLAGIPERLAGKAGYRLPEPKGVAEKVGAGLGGLGGFIKGPAALGAKIASRFLI